MQERKDLKENLVDSPAVPSNLSEVKNQETIHIDITQYKKVVDNREVNNRETIDDFINDSCNACCNKLCMCCSKCCRHIAACCEKFGLLAQDVFSELYPLLIRPLVADGLGQFFRGRDGELRIQQPFTDAFMYAGNPLLTLGDAILPISTKGGWGWPIFPSILGRFAHFFQLVGDFRNPRLTTVDKITHPTSALIGATMAVYMSLVVMSFANSLVAPNETILDNFSINPVEIIRTLLEGHGTGWDKTFIGVMGYIAATNGFLKGKDILNDARDWWNNLWAETRKDRLHRHLDEIKHLDPQIAQTISNQYKEQVKNGTDWKIVDMLGRGFVGSLASLPAIIFQQPAKVAQKITLPREWWSENDNLQGKLLLGKQRIRNNMSDCMRGIKNFFGLANTSANPAPQGQYILNYEDQKAKKKNAYASYHPTLLFSKDQNKTREKEFIKEISDNYYRDVVRFNLHQPLTDPVVPNDVTYEANKNWAEAARDNPRLQEMLKGNFPEGTPFDVSMTEYQKIKYDLKYAPSAPPIEIKPTLAKA